MSHIVTAAVEIKNEKALDRAIRKRGEQVGLQDKGTKVHELYGGQRVEGRGVQLRDWRHPVVIDTKTGKVSYDNYNGAWGKEEELDKLVQAYAAETQILAAEMDGTFCLHNESVLANGDMVLEFEAAAVCG